jgi:DNA-binding beta-propeller fold protein YncE
MRFSSYFLAGAVCAVAAAGSVASAAPTPAPLLAKPAVAVPRAAGSFDYMNVDVERRYLLAAHTGSRTLDVYNLDTGALIRQIIVGGAHGVAIDVKDRKYFVSTNEGVVAVVDRDNLVLSDNKVIAPGPGDAIAFDPKTGTVYVDEKGGTRVFTVNGKTNKLGPVVTIPMEPEYLNYDAATDKLYQNIVSTSSVVVIDPATNAVSATWSTLPATSPSGQAIDSTTGRIFVAGSNGILVAMDIRTGAVVAQSPIAPRVDQIVFDPGTMRVYCASGTGVISVVQETPAGLTALADVVVPEHAHTITADPKTHNVWISYGGRQDDFIMELTPP